MAARKITPSATWFGAFSILADYYGNYAIAH
ncbi:hypothetical protein DET50_106175 [Marinobacter pelagius]|uniref:Uncharacterized protein n=1 Tax=Marinobacter pelagius TaxID=379482 RepID=A0A366GT66_9GAMM|nr:hypothetical protein DET50_106175 [Marinobacter pelagius]